VKLATLATADNYDFYYTDLNFSESVFLCRGGC